MNFSISDKNIIFRENKEKIMNDENKTIHEFDFKLIENMAKVYNLDSLV